MAEIINSISYRDIAKIQTVKIKELKNQIENLKCWLIIAVFLSISVSIISFLEVKNFAQNPEKYLPANLVEVVEVPELEKLERLEQ